MNFWTFFEKYGILLKDSIPKKKIIKIKNKERIMGILVNLYELIIKLKNKKQYESLAPISNIKESPTLDMLINAVGDSKNYNIALSGKYGAGKSSIIRSFFKGVRKIIYKPLYISLGMLGLENGKIDVNEFCQEIEKSIIQQIIYKENNTKLPDSNIKRVSKLKKRNIIYIMIAIIVLITIKISSLYIENYSNTVKELIEQYNMLEIWWRIAICFGILGLAIFIARIIAKFLKKIDIKNIKFNFSNTEIAIEKRSTESLINKYMDELVYFFSMTNYNIVVIEDLDRFLKNDAIKDRVLIIFQKLKELNQVLNSSKQIKRKIPFIYVVKDDLFKDEEERTKFFDAIVPVIPIMSNYNSYAELKNRFENCNIDDKIMQDISPYINDYRVIKNLKNEYELYQKEINGDEIVKEKQLAMLVLKNLRPREYENLLNNNGTIYNIINKKEQLIEDKKDIINSYIKDNIEKINEYKKEKIKDFEELKRIAISSLCGKNSNRTFSSSLSSEQFLNNSMDYNKVKDSKIYIHDYRGYGFTESEIFEYFGGKESFLERANNIARKPEMEIEKLIIENEKYEKEKDDLEKKPFYELLVDDEKLGVNDDLIKMLLMNGYIDESYQDYMFKFKETKEINKNDYTYISNVRQHINSKYTYPIKNVGKVVEQLNENFFGTESILNYNMVDFLIKSEDEGIKEKQHYCLSMLSELNKNKENFIFGFIKFTENKIKFLTKLHNENDNTIYEILINNNDKVDKVELMIKNLLNIPEILTNKKINDFIRNYIEEKEEFSKWVELNENVKKSLVILNIKFKKLQDKNNDLIELIYNKNLYRLNSKMIKMLFEYKGLSEKDFEEKNLSIIMHNEDLNTMKEYIEKEKNEYIDNCYLNTTGIKNNINDIIDCLNNWEISEESKKKIIKSMPEQIENIKDTNTEFYEELIKNNKVIPTWENYYHFYCKNDNEITDDLLRNMELNIEEIKKRKVFTVTLSEEQKKELINFRAKIAKNNNLDINVYKQIIPICWISLGNVEENEIEDERLKILIENRAITFSDNNLQTIYNQVPEIVDIYINNNIEPFINKIENFNINENMMCDIIKSKNIKFKDKNKILEIVNISYINEDCIKFIINNYSQNKISKIKEELKEKMFKSTIDISYKLILLEKELDKNNSLDMIGNYLKLLPIPYKYIGNYESYSKAFSISKTKLNEIILKKLENKGFKFTKIIKKNKITIYNKK